MNKGKNCAKIMFLLVLPLFFIFIQSPTVSAEYIPIAESPVNVGDYLVYQVDYNFSGNEWQGYYRFVVTNIQIVGGSQIIKATWQSSENGVYYTLVDTNVEIGDISLSIIEFDEMTLIQQKYFAYSWEPSLGASGSLELEAFLAGVYQLDYTSSGKLYTGSNAYLYTLENSTHHDYDEQGEDFYDDVWNYKLGVLEKKCIKLINDENSDIFYFKWTLLIENSQISGFDLNYWGTPSTDDIYYGVGDIFVYNLTYFTGTETLSMKERFLISAMATEMYYKTIQMTIQVWDEDTSTWELGGMGSASQIMDYSLSREIYGNSLIIPGVYGGDVFIPMSTDFEDQNVRDYIEAFVYWKTLTSEQEMTIDIKLEEKYIEFSGSSDYEGLLTDQFFMTNYSDQGYMINSIMRANNSVDGLLMLYSIDLILSESSITPAPPVLSTIESPTTQKSVMVSWDDIFEAQSYKIYVNDTLKATIVDTSYLLDFTSYGTYNIQVTAVCGTKESDFSEIVTVVHVSPPPEVPGFETISLLFITIGALGYLFVKIKSKIRKSDE